MDYKHCCVIDSQGHYLDFVLVLLVPQESGGNREEIQYYELHAGESLVETNVPDSRLLKPRWNGTAWEETAASAEIAAWEQAHPTPPVPAPSELEQLREQVARLQVQLERLSGPAQ